MGIRCFVFGHRPTVSIPKNPIPMYSLPITTRDLNGLITYHPPIITGYRYYECYSVCEICKERFDCEDESIPKLCID